MSRSRVAAGGGELPERVCERLEPADAGAFGRHVFVEQEGAAGNQDAANLGDYGVQIPDHAQGEGSYDGVERRVGERKTLAHSADYGGVAVDAAGGVGEASAHMRVGF